MAEPTKQRQNTKDGTVGNAKGAPPTDQSVTQSSTPSRNWIDLLWHNNPALVQLLGLCPLLAISNTLVNSLGLAIATAATVTFSNALVSISRPLIRQEIRIPIYVLLIAGIVTITDLLFKAYLPRMYDSLGIFIPLIITNCAIIARAEIFAARNALWPSIIDGLATGAGFALALCALGGLRELLGQGTLFANADWLFGMTSQYLTIDFSAHYDGFLLALLPPGAFMLLALLIAIRNLTTMDKRTTSNTANPPTARDNKGLTL